MTAISKILSKGLSSIGKHASGATKAIAQNTDNAIGVFCKNTKPQNFTGLRLAPEVVCDVVELRNKTALAQRSLANIYSYTDDGILAFDGNHHGSRLRNEMRERILTLAGLNDKQLALNVMDDIGKKTPQLNEKSKYYTLGVAKFNNKTKEYIYLCQNLKDMPDLNGLRGKVPLSNRGKGLMFRLNKIKESGINTIIDLRSQGECPQSTQQILKELNLNYVNLFFKFFKILFKSQINNMFKKFF